MADSAHAGASPSWQQMWSANGGLQRGQAFDVGGASQTLLHELARQQYAAGAGMSALVPGCGRAYDALALAKHGFDRVVAVDLAPSACEAAKALLAESGDPAADRVEVMCADFFTLQGAEFDLVWDVTFLCALDLSVRERWAQQSAKLLKPGGKLLTCVFPICDKVGGPPYALSVPLVRQLLEPQGLAVVHVQEALPAEAQHRPGGGGVNGGVATATTALIEWMRP